MTGFSNPTFLYWAEERDLIRLLREAGEAGPWTDDPILRDYRFCNVSREDDRTTRWIKHHIRDPFDGGSALLHVVALARHINLPSTLGVLIDEGALTPDRLHWDRVTEIMNAMGGTIYSNAYMIRAESRAGSEFIGRPKIEYLRSVLSVLRVDDWSSREAVVKQLAAHYGIGTFMGGQIAADLAYTSLLRDAPDHRTWAPLGPGAVRGMNRALDRKTTAAMSEAMYLEVGRAQMEALPPDLVEDRALTLHDVASNINCETDKYLRIQNQEGRGRLFRARLPV